MVVSENIPRGNNGQVHSLLLVDGAELVRISIARLINSMGGFRVVAEAGDGRTALSFVEEHKPELVITELNLPDMSGVELILEMQRQKKKMGCAILTAETGARFVEQAIGSGAISYLSKRASVEELREGLLNSLKGERFLSSVLPPVTIKDVLSHGPQAEPWKDPLSALSPREREIFHLLAAGMPNTAIAKKLFISPRTVETHRARLVRKLDLKTNPELIRFAIRHGLSSV